MKRFFFGWLVVIALAGLPACRKRNADAVPTPTTSSQTEKAVGPSLAGDNDPGGKPSTPVAPATGLPQAKPGASENGTVNGGLTDAVYRFRDKHKRLPASLQELVQTGFLKALPTPPPGVRYAIDPISAMVVEVK